VAPAWVFVFWDCVFMPSPEVSDCENNLNAHHSYCHMHMGVNIAETSLYR
jgi:hypothetical protein